MASKPGGNDDDNDSEIVWDTDRDEDCKAKALTDDAAMIAAPTVRDNATTVEEQEDELRKGEDCCSYCR